MDTCPYLALILSFIQENLSALTAFWMVLVFFLGFLVGHIRNSKIHAQLMDKNAKLKAENLKLNAHIFKRRHP